MAKGDDVYMKVPVEDPASPSLDDVEQREVPPNFPAVSVKTEGPVRTQRLPNRQGNLTADTYPQFAAGAIPERVLNADPRRARAVLVAATKWLYLDSISGVRAPIPAGTVIVVEHCDSAWAFGDGGAAVITVITEFFAD